ncbi:hypothetical protein V6N13_008200 [Hibiscus sabdariffa]
MSSFSNKKAYQIWTGVVAYNGETTKSARRREKKHGRRASVSCLTKSSLDPHCSSTIANYFDHLPFQEVGGIAKMGLKTRAPPNTKLESP